MIRMEVNCSKAIRKIRKIFHMKIIPVDYSKVQKKINQNIMTMMNMKKKMMLVSSIKMESTILKNKINRIILNLFITKKKILQQRNKINKN